MTETTRSAKQVLEGSFQNTGWDEKTIEELGDGAKLTHASVTQDFSGGVKGEGSAEWLMAYRPDGTAHFVGLQHVRGSVEQRKGVFVVETIGEFDGQTATVDVRRSFPDRVPTSSKGSPVPEPSKRRSVRPRSSR